MSLKQIEMESMTQAEILEKETKTSSKADEGKIMSLGQIEMESITQVEILKKEIKETKNKLHEHKTIIAVTKTKIAEAKGLKISRRDYMFGFVQKIFRCILPATYAIYATILLNFLLSLTNAGSDLSVFFWLWSQQQTNVAYLILGVDYLPCFLTVTHHLTESLNRQVPMTTLILECLLLGFLYPFAVPICYSVFIMARIRGEVYIEEKFHYLATMATVIRTCFEDPFQLLLSIWFFSTKVIPFPWQSRSKFCDSLGNCLDLGSAAGVVSLVMTLLSLLKGTLDGYQSSDYLGFGSFLLVNIAFRVFSFSYILLYMREWIIILFILLFLINLVVHIIFRDKRSGINVLSSSFCSIFQPVVIPEKPELKQRTGTTSLDTEIVEKTSFWITIIQLPLIFLSVIATFFIVTRLDGLKQDVNIAFTTEQLKFFTICCLLPFFVFSMISTLVYKLKDNKLVKFFANILLLVGAVAVITFSAVQMPPSPQTVVLLSHHEGQLEVGEAVTFSGFLDNFDDNMVIICTDSNCTVVQDLNSTLNRGNKDLKVEVSNPQLATKKDFENKIVVLAPIPKNTEVFIYHPNSEKLTERLNRATCVRCKNETNFCRSVINGKSVCNKYCFNFPTEKIDENAIVHKIKNDRCYIQEFFNTSYFPATIDTPYHEGHQLEAQVVCSEPFPYPSANLGHATCQNSTCSFLSNVICQGNNLWKLEENCQRCTGKEYCKARRSEDHHLGNSCDDVTGRCVCHKDHDCMLEKQETGKHDEDCQFGGKCSAPLCRVTFDGKKEMMIDDPDGKMVEIHFPHKSCTAKCHKIVMTVVGGGGGGWCNQDYCLGYRGKRVSQNVRFNLLSNKEENIFINVEVGSGGEEIGMPSRVSGPYWWPHVEALGSFSKCLNDSQKDSCLHYNSRERIEKGYKEVYGFPGQNGVVWFNSEQSLRFLFGSSGGRVRTHKQFRVGLDFDITLMIKPKMCTGILAAVSGRKDYLILQLVDGSVKFSIDNGRGSITSVFKFNFCNDQWHEIHAVKAKNVVSLSVNKIFAQPGIGIPGVSSTDTKNPLFLGGHPRPGRFYVSSEDNNYEGYMKDVQIEGSSVTVNEDINFIGDVTMDCPVD